MAKRNFNLTEEQVKELKAAYHQGQDGLTKIRYQAVRLYGTGYAVAEIGEITGGSRPSLMEWCRAYRQCGVTGLVDKRQGGNRAKLNSLELESLQERLESYTPAQLFGAANCAGDGRFWSVPDLARLVKQEYGVSYHSTRAVQF